MSAPVQRGRALAVQRALGVLFLLFLALAVLLTVALYQQRFTPVRTVFVDAGRAGNQLTNGADVKVRGLLVGRVKEVSSNGSGARLELAIREDMADQVPADVQAQLLPKTLFGEKFVSLAPPAGAVGGPAIAEDAVIGQDRSQTAIETSQVLDRLLPLLQTLDPADVSRTLNAISGAVRGRGEAIGANAVRTRDYLARLNPALPTIQRDLVGLATFADTVDDATPDLLSLLDDLSFSSRSLVRQEASLQTFLQTSSGAVATTDAVLRENEQPIIRLAADSVDVLGVYARYAPGNGCFLKGLDAFQDEIEPTFGGNQPGLFITLESTQDNGGFAPGDEPVNGDDGGPTCRGLPPNQPETPFPLYRNEIDGYRDGQPVNQRTGEIGPQVEGQPGTVGPSGEPATPQGPGANGGSGSVSAQSSVDPQPVDWTRAILGTALGVPAEQVPSLAHLLFDPLAAGGTVRLG